MKLDELISFLKNNSSLKLYLGAPFFDSSEEVMEQRFIKITETASIFSRVGFLIYSPATHFWPQITAAGKPPWMLNPDFWRPFIAAFMKWADAFVVLQLDGWTSSKELSYEIESASKEKKLILILSSEE